VGRWDGTLSLFRTMASESETGPVLLDAMSLPSKRGIEMVVGLGHGQFVSSNDSASLAWWQESNQGFSPTSLPFDGNFGTAVSGLRVTWNKRDLLLVGHQHGVVTIWSLGDYARLSQRQNPPRPQLLHTVSVRSETPIPWQFQSWHVRGFACCGEGRVISVSEDGDICLLELPTGTVRWRRRYNPMAKRGLNDVAVLNDLVAVVNCAVGSGDSNLWLYRLGDDSLDLIANAALIQDKTRDQVFAFSVKLVEFEGQPHFVASTEEGLIWLGTVKDNKIDDLKPIKVAPVGGVVLALAPETKTVLSVAHKIQLFAVGLRPVEETVQP